MIWYILKMIDLIEFELKHTINMDNVTFRIWSCLEEAIQEVMVEKSLPVFFSPCKEDMEK